MFAYCNNNPIAYSDTEGKSVTLAATIGGAVAGALLNVISYIGSCESNGDAPTFQGTVTALAFGAVAGVIGGVAGGCDPIRLKIILSGVASFVSGSYAYLTGGNVMAATCSGFLGTLGGAFFDAC
jgi:hypothetical protein